MTDSSDFDDKDFEGARLASSDDIALLVPIAVAQAQSIDGQRGADMLVRSELPFTADSLTVALEEAVADPDQILIVGTIDDIPFGYAHVVLERLRDNSRVARLEQLLVDPEARGVGVGETMMNMVIAEATAHQCFGIDSRALPGDRETKNFFESFGMKARQLIVHLSLDDE